MSVLLSCKGLSKSYRGDLVLPPISFDLDFGEALSVTGPNGAGKTTLLSILAGLVQAADGQARFLGESLTPFQHGLRRRIGLSPSSENSLFLNASVRENLQFWASLQSAKAPIDQLAEEWDFASYVDRPVRELSSGYRRRVALARAFLHDPALVLLDEPFAFLDNGNLERTCVLLENWLGQKRGALIVSSNVDFTRGKSWKSLNLSSMSNRASVP